MKHHSFSQLVPCLAMAGLLALLPGAFAGPKDFSLIGEVNGVSKGYAAKLLAFDTAEGDPGRILAKPGETFSIRMDLLNARVDEPLRVSAGMGGMIDGRQGPLVRKQLGTPHLDLTFAVGKTRGRYLLEVRNGRQSQFLEFWVGDEPPQGKPGPHRAFTAPASLKSE